MELVKACLWYAWVFVSFCVAALFMLVTVSEIFLPDPNHHVPFLFKISMMLPAFLTRIFYKGHLVPSWIQPTLSWAASRMPSLEISSEFWIFSLIPLVFVFIVELDDFPELHNDHIWPALQQIPLGSRFGIIYGIFFFGVWVVSMISGDKQKKAKDITYPISNLTAEEREFVETFNDKYSEAFWEKGEGGRDVSLMVKYVPKSSMLTLRDVSVIYKEKTAIEVLAHENYNKIEVLSAEFGDYTFAFEDAEQGFTNLQMEGSVAKYICFGLWYAKDLILKDNNLGPLSIDSPACCTGEGNWDVHLKVDRDLVRALRAAEIELKELL